MELYARMHEPHAGADRTYAMSQPMLSDEPSPPHTVSSMMVESAGLSTVFSVTKGEKYLVIGEPLPAYAKHLNPASCGAFEDFEDFKIDSRYRWEGISLRQGTVLYVRLYA